MADIVTKDKNIYIPAAQLQPHDDGGRTQFQPLSNDWTGFVLTDSNGDPNFEYSSSTRITISTNLDVSPEDYFQKGDRLWIVQGGVSKWFAIIAATTTYIDVFGGSSYSVSNEEITYLASSRLDRPYNYPSSFEFDPDWNNNDSLTPLTVAYTSEIEDAVYSFRASVRGGEMNLKIIANNLSIGGSVDPYIYGILPAKPIDIGVGDATTMRIPIYVSQSTNGNGWFIFQYFTVGDTSRFQITKDDTSNFSTGDAALGFAADISYLF